MPKSDLMRGLVHNQKLQTIKLFNDLPVPSPSEHEHLLKVSNVAITGGELQWPRPTELNESCPGTDMAGEVVTAPAQSRFRPGDQVYMRTQYPRAGSAREFSIGMESELALRPKNVSSAEAAGVPVSALTAWQALFVQAGIKHLSHQENGVATGDDAKPTVLINGASGAVGLWMTQLAHYAGCKVIATASANNAKLVKDMGADILIDYTKISITDWAKNNSKVDFVFDNVGGQSQEDAWHAVRDSGKLFTIVPSADMSFKSDLIPPTDVSNTIEGRFFIMETKGEQLAQITKLIEQGKVRPTIDSVYELDDFQKAFDRVDSRRAVGKVVIKITD